MTNGQARTSSLTVDVIIYGTDFGIRDVGGRPIGAYTVNAQKLVDFEQLIVKCKFRYYELGFYTFYLQND